MEEIVLIQPHSSLSTCSAIFVTVEVMRPRQGRMWNGCLRSSIKSIPFWTSRGRTADRRAAEADQPDHRRQACRDTGNTVLRFGHWFGMEPQFWLNLQSAYEIRWIISGRTTRNQRPADSVEEVRRACPGLSIKCMQVENQRQFDQLECGEVESVCLSS